MSGPGCLAKGMHNVLVGLEAKCQDIVVPPSAVLDGKQIRWKPLWMLISVPLRGSRLPVRT